MLLEQRLYYLQIHTHPLNKNKIELLNNDLGTFIRAKGPEFHQSGQ